MLVILNHLLIWICPYFQNPVLKGYSCMVVNRTLACYLSVVKIVQNNSRKMPFLGGHSHGGGGGGGLRYMADRKKVAENLSFG